MIYKPRLTAADMPANDNKYYIRKADGGYSPCIKGYPQHKHLTALSNCVGWAIGRAMEILQTQTNPLPHLNAEDFYNNTRLEKGKTPKNGAIICWKQGKLWNSNDGCGHVAVVEKIISNNEIITSESAYGGMAYYTKRRTNDNGKWGASASYELMGFIYLPEECVPIEDNLCDVKIQNIPRDFAQTLIEQAESKGGTGAIIDIEDKPEDDTIKVGDKVKMMESASIYGTANKFASWVYSRELFVREINGSRVVVSTLQSGAVTGAVDICYLQKV